MSNEYRVAAPESMALHRMSASEIEGVVKEHSVRLLESLPDGFRPSGVNRVVLDATAQRAGGTEWGGWAEWTRACCGSRALIEDFSDPIIDEIERLGSPVALRHAGAHIESQLRIIEPQSLTHKA